MVDTNGIDWNVFIGRELANVTIVKELGRGTMGVVFTGFQKSLKRQVAVKVLHKAGVTNAAAWQSFRDEGETLAVLNHPNIVPIYEMGEADDCYFQVMQLVDGSDLRTILRRAFKHPLPSKRLLPLDQTLEIVIQVLKGLAFAHDEGIIHQDVKPGNILIERRDGRALIADFGIARVFEAEFCAQGKVVGTPLYMAPEQAAGKPTDGKTDIYSVGVILFEMCAGTLPVKDENVKELIERKKHAPETFFILKPAKASPLVDERLEHIIVKATAPVPTQRYAVCDEFIGELQHYRLERFSSVTGPMKGAS